MFRLPSHPVNGETIVSRYKSWQHLTLWTIVSLRMRDTPLSAKEDAGEKGDGSGPGDRERDMAALIAPFPPRDGIGGGPKEHGSPASSQRATPSASQLELAEGVKFLEEYAHLDHLEAPFGGGVTGPADTHTVRVWLPEATAM